MRTSDIRIRWERRLPLAGAAFTTLMVISTAAFPMPPGGDVSPAISRTTSERSSLPGAALIGGAFSGMLLLVAQAVSLAAALFIHGGGNPDTVRALGSLQDAFLDLSSLPAVLLFAATGLAALHTGLLPRWLTILTLLGVPFALLDTLSYDGGPVESVGILGLLYLLAWALLVGIRLYLNPQPDEQVEDRYHAAVPTLRPPAPKARFGSRDHLAASRRRLPYWVVRAPPRRSTIPTSPRLISCFPVY